VRVDKWLWAARFFKTRALAAKACELGRIESNGIQAKPAREVRTGDLLRVRNEGVDYHVNVRALSEIRGPAAIAQTLYSETEASRELRLKLAENHRTLETKPSKRDRRKIDRLRGRA
jgi:ribosome-associated heat shock protein Hsp15